VQDVLNQIFPEAKLILPKKIVADPLLRKTPLADLASKGLIELPAQWLHDFGHYSIVDLEAHYSIEKDLATRLMEASADERTSLYATLYDELFERVPLHPQLVHKADDHSVETSVPECLANYIDVDKVFLELGAGDCQVSFAVARKASFSYALDVSKVISDSVACPDNFELILSDGSSVELPPESIDIAYSNQLMEHLHPDDALKQLQGISRALRCGGSYVCQTPHRYGGPGDISRFFDSEPKGLHLHEYTLRELHGLLGEVGFGKVALLKRFGAVYREVPIWIGELAETLIAPLPYRLRRQLFKLIAPISEIRVIARRTR